MPGAPREDLRCAGSRTRAAVGVPSRARLTGEAAAVTAGAGAASRSPEEAPGGLPGSRGSSAVYPALPHALTIQRPGVPSGVRWLESSRPGAGEAPISGVPSTATGT